jgi:hypothetical protein
MSAAVHCKLFANCANFETPDQSELKEQWADGHVVGKLEDVRA